MNATRAASEGQLVAEALPRLDALLAEGVTTVEIKSGYGLALEHEAQTTARRARTGARARACTVSTTFLGAHALPPEFAGRADDYITEICDVMLPALVNEGLVDAVDAFCEHIGFSLEQTKRVFNAANLAGPAREAARRAALEHARRRLAAAFRALSADHLEYVDEAGIRPWRDRAHGGGAAARRVLFPARDAVAAVRRAAPASGVSMAIATDCNPGTSPLTSLLHGDEHGRNTVSHDRRRVPDRRHSRRRAGDRASHEAAARSRPASNATSRSGTSSGRRSWCVAMGCNPLHARVWRGE